MTKKKRNPAKEQRIKRALVKNSDGDCPVCGWEPPSFNRDKRRASLLEMHHIVPVASGGRHDADNMVLLCPNCHRVAHQAFPQRTSRSRYYGPRSRDEFIRVMARIISDAASWEADQAADVAELVSSLADYQ